MYRGGFSSYTKTGRNIALGRRFGESMARSHNNTSNRGEENPKTYYEYTITDTKIEILGGDDLVLMVAADNKTNIYKGTPEIWISKSKLQDKWSQETITRTIERALPKHLQGHVWLVRDNKILVTKNNDAMILLIGMIFFVIFIIIQQ
jgi:hypothetical protein